MKRITRADLLSSKESWMVEIQQDLYALMENYMKKKGLNRTTLAKKLGVSKGYITQVLKGDFDHKLSKLVELSLACESVPLLFFVSTKEFIVNDAKNKFYDIVPMHRPVATDFSKEEPKKKAGSKSVAPKKRRKIS